jgi:hypothetical protein
MRQVTVIAATAIGLALLGTATYAGCAIGRDHAASPEAIELLAAMPHPARWIVDGVAMTPADTGSSNTATQPGNSVHACWFDLDLPPCERP